MRKILFLIIFFVSGACDGQQKGKIMKKEIIKKSYKKQIISDEINRAESEFYDEKTGVYSNFKYLVSSKRSIVDIISLFTLNRILFSKACILLIKILLKKITNKIASLVFIDLFYAHMLLVELMKC